MDSLRNIEFESAFQALASAEVIKDSGDLRDAVLMMYFHGNSLGMEIKQQNLALERARDYVRRITKERDEIKSELEEIRKFYDI